mmetsp:Transcript_116122/g.339535  ORF Transcript_116122/g.339535 Transcript_116122/m.339535 type:complete len:203 (-) Transcript_116122:718-1326(-)
MARGWSSEASTLTPKSRPSSPEWRLRTSMARSAAGRSSTRAVGGGGLAARVREEHARGKEATTSVLSLSSMCVIFSRSRKALAVSSHLQSRCGALKLRQAVASRSGTFISSTSLRISRANSSLSSRLLVSFGPTPGTRRRPTRAASKIPARFPCLPSSCAAFFMPMPGTPGRLSLASPVSAKRSPIWLGLTPQRASTALLSM